MRNAGNRIKRILMGCLLLLGLCILSAGSVQAAQQKESAISLKARTRYGTYDITGDGRADTFYISACGETDVDEVYTGLKIYVNGKRVYQVSNGRFEDVDASLVTLSNGTPYICLRLSKENDYSPYCALLRWNSGRLVKAVDFTRSLKNLGQPPAARVTGVSGNKINVQIYLMSWSLGPSYLNYTYTYKNGSMVQSGTYGTLRVTFRKQARKSLTAGKSIIAYAKPGSTQRTFVLRKGSRVTTTGRCWLRSGALYFQVKYNGRTGWIRNVTQAPETIKQQQFSNIEYVG